MRNQNLRVLKPKKEIKDFGDVQFPIKVGEEVCYQKGQYLFWTDKVKRIIEIAVDYVRVETTSYFYTIEVKGTESGCMVKLAA